VDGFSPPWEWMHFSMAMEMCEALGSEEDGVKQAICWALLDGACKPGEVEVLKRHLI
jgi:hypothetical protein